MEEPGRVRPDDVRGADDPSTERRERVRELVGREPAPIRVDDERRLGVQVMRREVGHGLALTVVRGGEPHEVDAGGIGRAHAR